MSICVKEYHLKPREQIVESPGWEGMADAYCIKYGKEKASMVETGWTDGTTTLYFDHDTINVPKEWVNSTTMHTFVDTGTKRSWCKGCNANAHFDGTLGIYCED